MGELIWDLTALVGVALVLAGVWWMWPPLALILGGLALTAIGIGGARLWAISRGSSQASKIRKSA